MSWIYFQSGATPALALALQLHGSPTGVISDYILKHRSATRSSAIQQSEQVSG